MRRILLVDDEAVHLRANAATLRAAGYEVVPVACGDHALQAAQGTDFDAALVDLMMPRMNGIELIRQLHARSPALRVVLTSTFPLSCGQIVRLGIDPVCFVPKPASLDQLMAALGTPDERTAELPSQPPPSIATDAHARR